MDRFNRIIACYFMSNMKNGTIYIGSTNDLYRRVEEHKRKIYEGFTKKYGLNKLVYAERCEDLEQALILERRYKRYLRAWKIKKIEDINPSWDDLSLTWL
jgi:putative endonuclease